jgi:LysR family glycine cleavage system transcriptional activator
MANRQLPSLHALRAFECVARHRSFSRAAAELNVTPSAVSHQIRLLEAWVDVRLFDRDVRPPTLTASGGQYYAKIERVFSMIAAATHDLKSRDKSPQLRVATMDSFAATWLVPRLCSFRQLHPEINLEIALDDREIDFNRDNADVAIRYGEGCWIGTEAELLFKDEVFPVCAPALLHGQHGLHRIENLKHHTLLHDTARHGWMSWLRSVSLDDVIDVSRGPLFGRSYLAIQAATNGEGVAAASAPLVLDSLKSGRLLRPFMESVMSDQSYFLVYPSARPVSELVDRFRDWLLEERSMSLAFHSV